MVARINDHIMRRLGVSRRHLFDTIERPALAVLPDADYEFAEWGFARVSLDYHVEVCGYFYSVPHSLIRAQVDTRATARMIEIFFQGNRITVHERRYGGSRHGTNPEHMPSAHRRYAEWPTSSESAINELCRFSKSRGFSIDGDQVDLYVCIWREGVGYLTNVGGPCWQQADQGQKHVSSHEVNAIN